MRSLHTLNRDRNRVDAVITIIPDTTESLRPSRVPCVVVPISRGTQVNYGWWYVSYFDLAGTKIYAPQHTIVLLHAYEPGRYIS